MSNFKNTQIFIQYLNTSELIPYDKNPRILTDKHLQEVAACMGDVGNITPIIADENKVILAGHTRLRAAKYLGLKEVPVVILSHLTNKQKKLYRIADNKLTENGKWDIDLLSSEFKELSLDLELSELELTGFSTTEIDLFIEGISDSNSCLEDEIPPITPEQKPVTKLSDIWCLGKNKIICGDSTVQETYEFLMGNKKAQMIFTDPPYNVKIAGNVGGLGSIKHREFTMASGEMSSEDFKEFLSKHIELAIQYSKDGSLHYICMDWRHIQELLEVGLRHFPELKNVCVWVKDNGGMGSLYRSQHEFVCVFKNGSEPHINNVQLGSTGRYRTNVWNYAGVNGFGRNRDDLEMHPTVKPVMMIADAILDVTKRNDIVLDCFLGSGSTLIAANKVGRVCYGIEIDPIYIDTAIERFQNLTGLDAIHQASGKTFNELKEEING